MYDNRLYELPALLRANAYPGRGLALGMTADGQSLAAVYFIMGRSSNSRNRVFVPDGDQIRIEPYDKGAGGDRSLTIYQPMATVGDCFILSNGDQTDTVAEALASGGTFEGALRTRAFEPDAPNFTPRISGMLNLGTGAARLSVLRAGDSDGTRCDRLFYEYAAARGEGRFLHTYQGDGHPLPPFRGEPARVTVPDSPEAFAEELWDALNRDNRVALCVRYMDIGGGVSRLVIKNRHPEGGHHA